MNIIHMRDEELASISGGKALPGSIYETEVVSNDSIGVFLNKTGGMLKDGPILPLGENLIANDKITVIKYPTAVPL